MREAVWINQGWQPIPIAYVPTQKAHKKLQKEFGFEYEWPKRPGAAAHTALIDGNLVLVYLFDKEKRSKLDLVGTAVHEATHVWQYICQVTGEDNPGAEQEAYAIQFISKAIIEAAGIELTP